MNYQLLAERQPWLSPIEQVLVNRGIPEQEVRHYLNTDDTDILNPLLLANMQEGAKILIYHIAQNHKIWLQVDSDCDGYTSAALLINYLNLLFPGFAQNNISYRVHEGKQHGLIFDTIPEGVKLVIAPDSSSNDYEVHAALKERGIDVLVLDHHEADKVSEHACVINNQLCDYPTKSLSGVGVVYKFCSYIDQLLGVSNADQLLDLVALGIIADVMPLKDFETKRLINLGLQNIINPFFRTMTIKNEFSLKGNITPFGVAFYIEPYINATTRCGTQEEKILLFESMLDFKAYQLIPSTKRGFKGQFETVVEQACRNCTNIKNRQNKARDNSLKIIEEIIKEEKLLDNQIIMVKLSQDYAIDKELTGLVATKIASQYQKPTLILNEVIEEDGTILWAGSGRIFSQSAFTHFRKFVDESGYFTLAQGHEGAFGAQIPDANVELFTNYANRELASFDFSQKYFVDFIYDADFLFADDVLQIANYDDIWGQGIEEPFIVVNNVKVTNENLSLLKGTTLKITLPSVDDQSITLIKFGSSEEEFQKLYSDFGSVVINVVGHFQKNIWNGFVSPQILIEDFEIVNRQTYYF